MSPSPQIRVPTMTRSWFSRRTWLMSSNHPAPRTNTAEAATPLWVAFPTSPSKTWLASSSILRITTSRCFSSSMSRSSSVKFKAERNVSLPEVLCASQTDALEHVLGDRSESVGREPCAVSQINSHQDVLEARHEQASSPGPGRTGTAVDFAYARNTRSWNEPALLLFLNYTKESGKQEYPEVLIVSRLSRVRLRELLEVISPSIHGAAALGVGPSLFQTSSAEHRPARLSEATMNVA